MKLLEEYVAVGPGKRAYFTLADWKDALRLDIRLFTFRNGGWFPTQKAVIVPAARLEEVAGIIAAMRQTLEKA